MSGITNGAAQATCVMYRLLRASLNVHANPKQMSPTALSRPIDLCIKSSQLKFRVLTDSAHKPIGPMVFNTLKSKYQPPTVQEGFTAIITLPFVLDQTHEHLNLYSLTDVSLVE
ncbi:hypothetical protein EG68_01419 [Paragonimus skrjabini miyazakii]|uniref:Uncharacterized protein n=1 Tax=Paragonimus skrjabini miyazakii TaxID=59628 RepID=A0A8S9Z569_9TREM|nr:hypothetical protein EG68_01419 [Paragonimus skrjabini miyazakii]